MFSRKPCHFWLNLLFTCILLGTLLTCLATVTLSHAEVTLDGSLGQSGPVEPGKVPDGTLTDYLITHNLGRQANSNLFHSFGKFSIETGRSATFTGPPVIENVIGRVTGGELSSIDGLLRSTIEGANLFLLNPAGILFGPNAELDVRGSFHASTADYLRFGDGERFYANPAETSVLSVAPPEAFGFLDGNPAGITIEQSVLQVQPDKTLSVIGGDLTITGGTLKAPSGRINIASVASSGEVIPNTPDQPSDLKADSFSVLGEINISQDPITSQGSLLDTSTDGDAGGTVLIRGGQLRVIKSYIFSDTLGDVDGAPTGIDVQMTGDVVFTDESYVTADVTGAGKAGKIHVRASNLEVSNGAVLGSRAWSGSSGNAGDISVSASTLVTDHGYIQSVTFGSGDAGQVSVKADTLKVDDGIIQTATVAQGDAGSIDVEVREMTLEGGGGLLTIATSSSSGKGGSVEVTATESVTIAGESSTGRLSGLFISTYGSGDAGPITINADTLKMDDGIIQTATIAEGDAGSIDVQVRKMTLEGGGGFLTIATSSGKGGGLAVTATESVTIAGESSNGYLSGLFSHTYGSGDAGSIDLQARELTLAGGGLVYADAKRGSSGRAGSVTVTTTESVSIAGESITGYQSGLFSNTLGSGNSGRVTVNADTLKMDGGLIQSVTTGQGNAGSIDVQVREMTLAGGAEFITRAESGSNGDGGSVKVTATESVTIAGESSEGYQSGLFSQSLGSSNAGSIDLQVAELTLADGGWIYAIAEKGSSGKGGSVMITAIESVSIAGESSDGSASGLFNSTFGSGDAGRVTINADTLKMAGGLIQSVTGGQGSAGSVDINTRELTLTGGGRIRTSANVGSSGNAGTIKITETESVTIAGKSSKGYHSGLFSYTQGSGDAGSVELKAPMIDLTDGAKITTSTEGTGKGGTITVHGDRIRINGEESEISADTLYSVIISETALNGGPEAVVEIAETPNIGGDIVIGAKLIEIQNGAKVSATSKGTGRGGTLNVNATEKLAISQNSGLFTSGEGSGSGGSIELRASKVQLTDGAVVSAKSSGLGDAGNIDITATNTFLMKDSSVTTEAEQASGGNIKINADYMVRLGDSEIKASVQGGPDTVGGDINIDPEYVILSNSNIIANAAEGKGGNIQIVAGVFLADPNCIVDASSEKGIDGTVDIRAPIKDVSQSVTRLPEEYLSAAELLREACIARIHGGKYSSFVVKGRDGLPLEPGNLLPSPIY